MRYAKKEKGRKCALKYHSMVIDVSRLQAKEKLKPGVRLAVHWPPGVIRQDRGVLSPTRVDCFSGHCNGCRLGLIWYAGYGGGRWWEAERRGLYYKLTKWGLSGGRRHWERERWGRQIFANLFPTLFDAMSSDGCRLSGGTQREKTNSSHSSTTRLWESASTMNCTWKVHRW